MEWILLELMGLVIGLVAGRVMKGWVFGDSRNMLNGILVTTTLAAVAEVNGFSVDSYFIEIMIASVIEILFLFKWKFDLLGRIMATRFSLRFSAVLLCGYLLSRIIPDFSELFGLVPNEVFSAMGFYRLFTYWIVQPSIPYLLATCLSCVVSGILLERDNRDQMLILIIACGVVLGGLAFATLEDSYGLLVGCYMGVCSYNGATIASVYQNRGHASFLSRLYAILLGVELLLNLPKAFELEGSAIGCIIAYLSGVLLLWFQRSSGKLALAENAKTTLR